MDRGRVLAAVALLLAVLAVGTIAGGFSAGSAEGGERSPGLGIGSGEGSLAGDSSGVGIGFSNPNEPTLPQWIGIGILLAILWSALLVTVGYVAAFLWGVTVAELIEAAIAWMRRAVMVSVVVLVFVLALLFLAEVFQNGGGGVVGSTVDAGTNFAGDATASVSADALVGIVIAVGGVVLFLIFTTLVPAGSDEPRQAVEIVRDGGEQEGSAPTVSLPPTGDAADARASNEVYRAWATLEDRVGGRDAAQTPAELERRALEAGLDERAVGELTTLFNGVRYGDEGVTASRERRAVALSDALDEEHGSANTDKMKE